MSTFHTGKIEAEQVLQGDYGTINVTNAAASLDELSTRVDESVASIREIEAAIVALRDELGRKPMRMERIRALLSTLATGAGTITSMVEGVEKVRQAIG